MDTRPNHTIYVKNLNDKIKKPDLKRALYYLFSAHGRLLDIVAMKTMKMRGQAFIVFQDIANATHAIRSLQGFQLFKKPMRLHYARKDSIQIAELKGVSAEAQRRKDEEKEKKKRKKLAQRAAAQAAAAAAGTQANTVSADGKGPEGVSKEGEPGEGEKGDLSHLIEAPHHTLYVSNLPEETTEAMLTMLFGQFSGFKEARRAAGGVAFVEYDSDEKAALARESYNGFKLTPTHSMEVKFAKK